MLVILIVYLFVIAAGVGGVYLVLPNSIGLVYRYFNRRPSCDRPCLDYFTTTKECQSLRPLLECDSTASCPLIND